MPLDALFGGLVKTRVPHNYRAMHFGSITILIVFTHPNLIVIGVVFNEVIYSCFILFYLV